MIDIVTLRAAEALVLHVDIIRPYSYKEYEFVTLNTRFHPCRLLEGRPTSRTISNWPSLNPWECRLTRHKLNGCVTIARTMPMGSFIDEVHSNSNSFALGVRIFHSGSPPFLARIFKLSQVVKGMNGDSRSGSIDMSQPRKKETIEDEVS